MYFFKTGNTVSFWHSFILHLYIHCICTHKIRHVSLTNFLGSLIHYSWRNLIAFSVSSKSYAKNIPVASPFILRDYDQMTFVDIFHSLSSSPVTSSHQLQTLMPLFNYNFHWHNWLGYAAFSVSGEFNGAGECACCVLRSVEGWLFHFHVPLVW